MGDVLIAVVDGLKGFPDAIEAVFPQATVQTCLVHLIRRSLAYVSYKERRALAAALKTIYRAPTEAAAQGALEALEAGAWGQKYPAIMRSWRSAWEHVVPFLAFSEPIRRAIYTTNAIESLNSTVRRAVRIRGHFPNDRAATKLIYLALRRPEARMAGSTAVLAPGAPGVRDPLWRALRGRGTVTVPRDIHPPAHRRSGQ